MDACNEESQCERVGSISSSAKRYSFLLTYTLKREEFISPTIYQDLESLIYHDMLSIATTSLCSVPVLGILDPPVGYIYTSPFVGSDLTYLVAGA